MPDGAMPIFVSMPNATKDQINKQCTSDDGSTCNADTKEITLGGSGTDELMKVDANGISTGGTSKNIISAIVLANKLNCKTIGLSGKSGGEFNNVCSLNIVVASDNTPRIQEMHILIGHVICDLIEKEFSKSK